LLIMGDKGTSRRKIVIVKQDYFHALLS
jgi:hypothetical protein